MRILVTRPEPDGHATAARLLGAGFEVVLAPVSVIEPAEVEPVDLSGARFGAVVATSANGFRAPDAVLAPLRALPLFAVGERTGAAARAAGFGHVRVGPGTAGELATLMAGTLKPGTPVLYLAGSPRKRDLEEALAAAGIACRALETYRTRQAERLAPAAASAFASGQIDVVLHYSRAAAERFVALARASGCDPALASVRHLCLSGDVAAGLAPVPPQQIAVADRPTEAELIALIQNER